MPPGTRVHDCVQEFKRKGKKGNAYAICQASTGQSYHTGKPLASVEPFKSKKGRK